MSLAACIESYLFAKDGNRPHLLTRAFEPDATVTLEVQTDQIDFPARLAGRDAIARELISNFSATYENVYTLCLATPPATTLNTFSCPWLVAMTSRQDLTIRVGWGRYDWVCKPAGQYVSALTITITEMVSLAPQEAPPILDWLGGLSYPWCSLEQLWSEAPALEAMSSWPNRIS